MKDNEFTTRSYNALLTAWAYTCGANGAKTSMSWEEFRKVKESAQKTFTIANLCKNYDRVANTSGVGPKALSALRYLAEKHGLQIKSEFPDPDVKKTTTIPIK